MPYTLTLYADKPLFLHAALHKAVTLTSILLTLFASQKYSSALWLLAALSVSLIEVGLV